MFRIWLSPEPDSHSPRERTSAKVSQPQQRKRQGGRKQVEEGSHNTNVVEYQSKKSENRTRRMAGDIFLHAADGKVMRKEAYRGR